MITVTLDNSILPQGGDVTEREQFYTGSLAFSGNYTTGGDPLSFAVQGILSNSAPVKVEVYEEPIAGSQTATGLQFVYAKGTTSANGTLQIFTPGSSSGTIVSTSTAPTITTGTNATVTAVVATNGGALTQAAGAAGITGVQAPTITSTFTGATGAFAQHDAGAYGALLASTTVKFRAWFPLGR